MQAYYTLGFIVFVFFIYIFRWRKIYGKDMLLHSMKDYPDRVKATYRMVMGLIIIGWYVLREWTLGEIFKPVLLPGLFVAFGIQSIYMGFFEKRIDSEDKSYFRWFELAAVEILYSVLEIILFADVFMGLS